jgi:predicted RNase H-like HicB family nuclease
MRYAVVVEQADRSFGAYVPDLPGCVAAAASREEVLALMREAIDLHLQALREKGEAVPAPTSTTEYVEV